MQNLTLTDAIKSEYKQIKKLYKTAFPAKERAPFSIMMKRAEQKKARMLVAKYDGKFVGFIYVICHEDLVYLFFFAVEQDLRGGGYGSAILELLFEMFKGKRIFLAREPIDPSADNNAQRVSRRNFYLKNGFEDINLNIYEAGVKFDVMSNAPIAAEDYAALITCWYGRFFARLFRMHAELATSP